MGIEDIKIAAFIQARLGSTRLKNKILLPLANKSILLHIVERIQTLKNLIDYIVIVTPEKDKELIREHLKNFPEVIVFGGSEENVLERFYLANKKIDADIIIRITADNPLVDTMHLKKALLKHYKNGADYTIYKNLPLGTGFEIISKNALEVCYKNSTKDYQFEHVTPYIREHKNEFKILELKPGKYYRHPEYRLTIDEEPDYKLMTIIYENLYKGKALKLRDVIKFIQDNPTILEINKNVNQKIVP